MGIFGTPTICHITDEMYGLIFNLVFFTENEEERSNQQLKRAQGTSLRLLQRWLESTELFSGFPSQWFRATVRCRMPGTRGRVLMDLLSLPSGCYASL